MSRYLITGAAGFIAFHVASLLLDRGDEVVGVDNMNDAYDVRLKEWRLGQLTPRARFRFERLDVSDRGAVESFFSTGRALGPVDGIVNLAARAGIRESVRNPQAYVETNVTGTLNLLEACRKHGIQRFVLASSSSVYGDSARMPFREEDPLGRPLSPYAATKRAAEDLCASYAHVHGVRSAVLRYFTVYGPAGRPDMSPLRFVRWVVEGQPVRVFGDGRQSRNFTHVEDIARGTVAALDRGQGWTFNLASRSPVRLLDFIALVERAVGREARVVFEAPSLADVPETSADVSRAESVLGWSPAIGCEEGVRGLVTWYAENREWAAALEH